MKGSTSNYNQQNQSSSFMRNNNNNRKRMSPSSSSEGGKLSSYSREGLEEKEQELRELKK